MVEVGTCSVCQELLLKLDNANRAYQQAMDALVTHPEPHTQDFEQAVAHAKELLFSFQAIRKHLRLHRNRRHPDLLRDPEQTAA